MRSSRWIGLSMAVVVLSWGLNYVVTKIGVSHLAPVNFVFWRFLATAVLCVPWMVRSWPRTWRDVGGLVIMGLVGVSLYQWLFTTALHLTLSANVAFLFTLSPLLTLLWQRIRGKDRPGSHVWWGALVSFAGVGFLAGASVEGGFAGDLVAFLAAASWSAFALVTEHFKVRVRGLAQTGWISLVGAIGMVPFVHLGPVWQMGFGTWGPLLYTILFVTMLGLSFWQGAVERVGAGRASLALYGIPLVAAVAGWVFLGEPLSLLQGLGAMAIVVGVALADGRFRRRMPPAAPEVA